MNHFGQRLRIARMGKNLSQQKLAALTGLSTSAIRKYENGSAGYPSSDALLRLSNALRVTLAFLLRPIPVSLESLQFRTPQIKLTLIAQVEKWLELESIYPPSCKAQFLHYVCKPGNQLFKQLVFHALHEEHIGESKAAELLEISIEELRSLQ